MSSNETSGSTAISTVSPTESEVMTAIRSWLMLHCPDYVIIQMQQNNVPTPIAPFGLFQPISRTRTSTNGHYYSEDGATLTIQENMNLVVQFTAFGETAGDDVMKIQIVWRDHLSCDWFAENLPQAMPTFGDEPVQKPFITAEKDYEDSWSVDLHLNVNKTISFSVDSAKELHLNKLEPTKLTVLNTDTTADQLSGTTTPIK